MEKKIFSEEEKEVEFVKRHFLSPYELSEEVKLEEPKLLLKRGTGPKCL